MTEGAPPVAAELILNTVGLSLISPGFAGGELFRASLILRPDFLLSNQSPP